MSNADSGKRYRIVLRGRLGERFAEAFDGMSLSSRHGETVLEGRLSDQSQLFGVAGEELSEREFAVLRLLSTPMSQREIGDALYVSLNTVKSHVKNIFRELDASSRGEAVARGHERGIV